MDDIQRAWVVGILEGEGHFGVNRRRVGLVKKLYTQLRIECNMTDEDVILKLAEYTEMGRTYGPYSTPSRPTHSPIWRYVVNRQKDAEFLMRELYPFMGKRRRAQIETAFQEVSVPLPLRWA